jgi:hypothetical protein
MFGATETITIKPVEVKELKGIVLTQDNSVVGNKMPENLYFITLGSLYDNTVFNQIGDIRVDECFYKIIEAESNFNPNAINKEYGTTGGVGLGQLIPSTIKYCEEKLGRKLDPLNPKDNLDCSLWLYKTYGTKPWGTATTWWGSYWKWSQYCD